MIFILIGPPGAGKGTHSDALLRDFPCTKIATGDILRRHIKEGSSVGRRCEEIIGQGRLVDDATLWELLEPELTKLKDKAVILDGYPRNLAQATQLQEVVASNPIRAVVYIEADDNTLMERLCGRMLCPNCQSIYHRKTRVPRQAGLCDNCQAPLVVRPDDELEKVRTRLDIYAAETHPVVNYYQGLGLLKAVDGSQGIAAVYEQIKVMFRTKMV